MEKINYTIGVYFDEKLEKIALILKKRPEWQKGKFNFPGGRIEENETPEECVAREFKEECCIYTNKWEWIRIGEIKGEGYVVYILASQHKYQNGELKTGEDQQVMWFNIDNLPCNRIPNVKWIMFYALNIIIDLLNGQKYECLDLNNVFNYSVK